MDLNHASQQQQQQQQGGGGGSPGGVMDDYSFENIQPSLGSGGRADSRGVNNNNNNNNSDQVNVWYDTDL